LLLTANTAFLTPVIAKPITNGRYTQLESGESIPWRGWCFDEQATAKILVDKETRDQKCQLKVDKEVEKLMALRDYDIGKLKIRLDYEINTRQASVDALTTENRKLEQTIIHNSKFGWITPLAVGVLSGFLIGVISFGK